ncbi:hypothetical protein VTJ04DRAFT_3736 [Mycothermus thermophilus]|uniref:uncharacterized protein n=1 Tax=Humicola insolens TaxID=85995 RepID=UPI003743BD4A
MNKTVLGEREREVYTTTINILCTPYPTNNQTEVTMTTDTQSHITARYKNPQTKKLPSKITTSFHLSRIQPILSVTKL